MSPELLNNIDAYFATALIAVLMAVALPVATVFNYRNFRKHGVLFVLIAFGFLTSMATKWKFDTGLHNNGSYATNDTVCAKWTRDMSVPATSDLYVDYRLSTDTNGLWQTLIHTTAGALTATATLADATNYDYFVWADYVPPTPVHTNGVWKGFGGITKDGMKYLTIQGNIYDHGEKIATPERKLK